MHEEARAAPHCVGTQLRHDNERYRELGARLRLHPPVAAVTLARGSSDHAASYLSYLAALRGGHMVASLCMSLVTLHRAPIRANGLLAISISQSGRSPDIWMPMQQFRDGGATTVALVNDASSPLANAAECVLPLHAGAENSIAASKSFICSLVAAARMVAHWAEDSELLDAIQDLPLSLQAACAQEWALAVNALSTASRAMVIGRGAGLSIAQEAALKFKETCGIQAEAFSSAEVRHGPMALVESGYPMLVFAPRGPTQADLIATAGEMRARGAQVLLAAPNDIAERQLTLATAATPDLDPIVAIQSFYMMVEALAVARGYNPDRPPHLNKVTMTL